MLRIMMISLCLLSIVGCSSTENIYHGQLNTATLVNVYDPMTAVVNDVVGAMTVSEVSTGENMEGRPTFDVKFQSEVLQIEGTFENLKASGFDTDVILFLPNDEVSHYFPVHNLFDHELRLYISDVDKIAWFKGESAGTARISMKDYYDYVNYKDEIIENIDLLEVIEVN